MSSLRRSLGARGNRAYLWRRYGDVIYCRLGQGPYRSLHTDDWATAERKTHALLSLGGWPEDAPAPQELQLGELVYRYLHSPRAAAWKSERYRREVIRTLGRMVRLWGADQRVIHLTPNRLAEWRTHRARVGASRIHQELMMLRGACTWAMLEVPAGHTERLLPEHPFRGMQVPVEKNPRRPVLTHEDFLRLREAGPPAFTLMLDVFEATGKRFQQVAHLKPADLGAERIRWRPEEDKMGTEQVTWVPQELLARLRAASGRHWVFPKPTDKKQPTPYGTFRNWWTRGAKKLGMVLPKGSGAHAIRRKWATERGDGDLRTLQTAGGWGSEDAMRRSYLHTDQGLVDQLVSTPTRRVTKAGIVPKVGTKVGTFDLEIDFDALRKRLQGK